MNKHSRYALRQLQLLPLEDKIKLTKLRIEQWYEEFDGMVYVSFSGGKDSTVLKHIVDSMYSDVPSVFANTGLEYPEIVSFATSQKNVEVVRPKMTFRQVLDKYGYPIISKQIAETIYTSRQTLQDGKMRIRYKKLMGVAKNKKTGEDSMYNCSQWKYLLDADFKIGGGCCYAMKKSPLKKYERETGRKPFVGTMAEESLQRTTAWIMNGCNSFNSKRPMSTPLAFWTEQDIFHYIKKYNVEFASVYGEIVPKSEFCGQCAFDGIDTDLMTTGVSRTGCMFCMFGVHLESHPNRFERMKLTHPKLYEYCMKPTDQGGLGLDKVLNFINVSH